jgi:predicted Rossmann fold nucleotide-binding protein DprA/Smf involved in DNA uptake
MSASNTTNAANTPKPADQINRDVREVIRDEHLMRDRILKLLQDGPLTIPEIAEGLGRPTFEVTFWVMGMRKYGYVAEIREATDEGYFQYQAIERDEP